MSTEADRKTAHRRVVSRKAYLSRSNNGGKVYRLRLVCGHTTERRGSAKGAVVTRANCEECFELKLK